MYVYAELKKSLALRRTKSRTMYTENKFHICKFLWVRSTSPANAKKRMESLQQSNNHEEEQEEDAVIFGDT